MDIRLIQPSELNDLLALYAQLHKSDDPLPEPAVVQAVWQELMANPRHKYFGSYVDSRLVSSCAISFEHGELRGYYPSLVRWAITVTDPEHLLVEIALLAEDATEWPSHWSMDVKDLWLEIALAECKEYFRYSATERELPEAGEKSTETMLKSLLQHFSVGQCYRIIWAGAQRAADFLVRKRCNTKHAANYMVGECQRWADRARAEKWEVKPFKRNFNLPRSVISHVFFDVFLKIGEDGFNCVPGIPAKHRTTVSIYQADYAQD